MDTEEIKKDEALAETLEEVAAPQEQPQEAAPVTEENPNIKDEEQGLRFRVLREAREKAERERDELKRQLEASQKPQQPQPAPQEDYPQEDYSIAPDDLVEGKHLSKYDREMQSMRKELDTYKQQAAEMSVEARIKAQYQDYYSVVNDENIAMLRTAHPEIAATIGSSTDLYSKAVAAYTMIKRLGIAEDKVYEKQRNKAHENAAKPRPVASVNAQPGTDSPLSRANAFAEGLTKDVKEQLYQEMLEAKKRRSK